MKTIIVCLSIIITASFTFGQSSIVYDAGTNIDIGAGADVCAANIVVNGTSSGSGTFCNAPVDVENENTPEIPKEFSLSQNYPNPFNPVTKISYRIPETALVKLKVFNLLGKEVLVLVDEERPAGKYEVSFNGENLASGVYFYTLQANLFSTYKKMILLR